MIKEAVSGKGQLQLLSPSFYPDPFQSAHGRFFCPPVRAEGAEIVRTQQPISRPPHSLFIQLLLQGIDVFPFKHIVNRAVPDPIAVGFARRVQPAVKPKRRFLSRKNGDILRQITVQLLYQLRTAQIGLCPEISHLPQSVDASVRTPGSGQLDAFPKQPLQNGSHPPLYGIFFMLLTLPAAVPASVVLKHQPYVSHKFYFPFPEFSCIIDLTDSFC